MVALATGAEDSLKGARILLSTKSANRFIADVYAVREDHFKRHETEIRNLVHEHLLAEERLGDLEKNKIAKNLVYLEVIKASALILLDSAIADVEVLYQDAQFVGHDGNQPFSTNSGMNKI